MSPFTPAIITPRIRRFQKSITFTGNANFGATGSNVIVATVTGEVSVTILPFCSTTVTENGATSQLSLGIVNIAALFVAATEPEDIVAGTFWYTATPQADGLALPAALKDISIQENIIAVPTVDHTSGGVVEFNIEWVPISPDGLLVPA